MCCNPAMGGLGKGHLVREIDALDGLMGRAADAAGIQFRLLNRRKGPAVQGPRAQADRSLYREAVNGLLQAYENLTVVTGEVADIDIAGGRVAGVCLRDGMHVAAKAVVLTTGTFLNGVIHLGLEQRSGGRMGDAPSRRLADRLYGLDLPMGRLKTGTPPRLDGRTIDWERLETQPGDEQPVLFSFLSKGTEARQISCALTRTTEATHALIRQNLDQSAMYGGAIEGIGPRYCPSIEDKISRFADKDSHQIFLEPEGLTTDVVYPNGISTSLPQNVQERLVATIPGLESSRIVQPGYAIEYDFVDPRCLDRRLALRDIEGLFLAGQINGTTGYEEAAAQGLVAGLNAARLVGSGPEVVFTRQDSYIGVLVDDLVTQGVTEPYRMFTSRAEYRLTLRADNADQRLTPFGIEIGCVRRARRDAFGAKAEVLAQARTVLDREVLTDGELAQAGARVVASGKRRTAFEALSLPDLDWLALSVLREDFEGISRETGEQLARDALYAGYRERQEREVAALRQEEACRIPGNLDYEQLPGLSNELRKKLTHVRPETLGQARRIDGMTPAALTLILLSIRRAERELA